MCCMSVAAWHCWDLGQNRFESLLPHWINSQTFQAIPVELIGGEAGLHLGAHLHLWMRSVVISLFDNSSFHVVS